MRDDKQSLLFVSWNMNELWDNSLLTLGGGKMWLRSTRDICEMLRSDQDIRHEITHYNSCEVVTHDWDMI